MSARSWAAFAAVSLLWGVPYFFIKVAVDEVSPAFVAWARVAIAAVVLLPLAWRLGTLRGLRPFAPPLVAYAAMEIALPFLLIPTGEQYISSSLTAILIATMPLTVAGLAARFVPAERPTGLRLAGLLLGLGGVVALLGIDVAGRTLELLGAACVLLATVCYAGSTIVVKRRLAKLDPLGPVAVSLGLSALALTPAALLAPPATTPSAPALGSLLALGLGCTAVALLLFFFLVADAGPSAAGLVTYVNPAVAVVLGVAVLGERLTAVSVAGLLLILAGSWLATGGGLPPGLAALARRGRRRPGLGEAGPAESRLAPGAAGHYR